MAVDFYNSNLEKLEQEHANLSRRSRRISWFRLALFLAFAAAVFYFFKLGYSVLFLILALLVLGLFVFVALKHAKLEAYMQFLSSKITVNRDELQFLNHDYTKRYSGQKFEKLNPFLSVDFTVFGDHSLFQYLNRCATAAGQQLLAHHLTMPDKLPLHITNKQKAIAELKDNTDFIQDFQAYSKQILPNNNDMQFLVDWAKQTTASSKWSWILAVSMGIVNVLWIVLSSVGVLDWTLIIIPIIISQTIIFLNRKKSANYNTISNDIVLSNFRHFEHLLQLIENKQFEATSIRELRLALNQQTMASARLAKLVRLLNIAELQNFGLVSILLNSVLFTDLLIYVALNEWKKENSTNLEQWIATVAEMEVLISLATFAFNNAEQVSFPELATEAFQLQAEELGHPLIHPAERVTNNFAMGGAPSIQIITGANMAGKSTFLRTVAVNLILASCGAPVVARKMRFTPCDILSSIKVHDSLAKHESYFYAELSRLKDIVEHVERNPTTLVILDEILRGTNTKDKQTGSLGILEKLIKLNAVVMIATHDLSIGELESQYPNIAQNSCFEVELHDDQLYFDYKIKPGISKKLNASYLLHKMGLID